MSMPFRVQSTPATPVPVPLYPGTGRPKPSREDQQIVQGVLQARRPPSVGPAGSQNLSARH